MCIRDSFWISIFQTRKDLATFSAPKVALSLFTSASGSPTGISSRFSNTPSNPSPFNHPKTERLNTRREISTFSPFLKTPVQVCKSVFCQISILEDVPEWGFPPRSRASVSFINRMMISAISTADGGAAAEDAKGLRSSSCWPYPSDLWRTPISTPSRGDPAGRMVSRPSIQNLTFFRAR